MDLDRSLLKNFSKLVNTVPEERFKNENVRGTVKMVGEKKYVMIDGSETLTPITETVDVQEGDRVLLTIENHRATILGNYTFPPSARKEQEALDSAGEAKEESSLASQKAQSAIENANQANENASIASSQANEAKELAEDAKTKAEQVAVDATEAKEQAGVALSKAEEAHSKALESFEATNAAQQEIDSINREVSGVKEDITGALSDLGELAKETQTIKETMEVEYTKKTELSSVEASLKTEISKSVSELQTTMSETYFAKSEAVQLEGKLQSQITQNAEGLGSVVSKTEKLESDTAAAQLAVNEAKKTAAEAQTNAQQALTNASNAQSAADQAKANANAATEKANAAQAAADKAQEAIEKADADLAEAKTDLAEAQKNLTNVTNRVDATEEEIAAAQQAVTEAQQNVNKALEDVAEAQYAAGQAQSAANKAQEDADNAKNTANQAQQKADDAKTVADKAQSDAMQAQKDVASLTNRVTTAETNINQNAENITLNASKTEEIGNKLVNDYYSKTQTDAQIKVSSDNIKQEVSQTIKTEVDTAVDAIDIGGRNYVLNRKGTDSVPKNGITCEYLDNAFRIYGTNTKTDTAYTIGVWIDRSGVLEPGKKYTLSIDKSLPVAVNAKLYGYKSTDSTEFGLANIDKPNMFNVTFTTPEDFNGRVVGSFVIHPELKIVDYTVKLKLEKGSKATDWTPAPEDVDDKIQNAQDTAVDISRSYVDQTATEINSVVEGVKSTVDGYSSSISTIQSAIKQTESRVDTIFTQTTEIKDLTEQNKTDLDEYKQYISMEPVQHEGEQAPRPTITLGESTSNFKVAIDNKEIAFTGASGEKVAYITGDELRINNVVVVKQLAIGGFFFVEEPNGHLVLKKGR